MIDPAKARRILVVALDALGDLVFASALVPPLRAAFPDARIDLWSKAYTAPVAKLIAGIDDVISADPFWAIPRHIAKPSKRVFLKSVGEVRRRQYDVAIVTGAPWRTSAAVAATRIPVRIALRRNHNHHFITHVLPAENQRRSVLLEQARLLEPLGVRSVAPRYALDADRLGSLRRVIGAQLPGEFVAIHAFASGRTRCLPLSVFSQLSFALHAQGLPVLWIGTSGELAEVRASAHAPGYYVDQLGNGSLSSSAAALSLASLFIGHDSGPLHVSGAFGIPVLGLFAPGQPERTFPQGVGPWRMIARSTPAEIDASAVLREVEALRLASPA